MTKRAVPAEQFVYTLAENVDNINLSDEEFRKFIHNTLSIVINSDYGDIKKQIEFNNYT